MPPVTPAKERGAKSPARWRRAAGQPAPRLVCRGRGVGQRCLWLALLIVLAACGVAASDERTGSGGAGLSPLPTPATAATVLDVIDGDTIRVRFAGGRTETVRYIGIDTPETDARRGPVECYGAEATQRNAELVRGKTVRLERDVSERDRYGRLLRYVWVAGEGGGRQLANEALVREGFATAATFPPDVRYQRLLAAAQREAQEQRRGLWGACPRS